MCCAVLSHSVMSDSLQPHGLEPTRLLCPWDSLGKNTGVGCPSPGDLPNPGIEPRSPALQTDSLLRGQVKIGKHVHKPKQVEKYKTI